MALAAQRGAGCARRPAVWPPHPPTRRGPGPDPALSKLSRQAAEFGAEVCCKGSLSLGKVGRKGSLERGLERAVELRSSQVDCTWRVPGTLVRRACQNRTYRVANSIFTATEDSKYVNGSGFPQPRSPWVAVNTGECCLSASAGGRLAAPLRPVA